MKELVLQSIYIFDGDFKGNLHYLGVIYNEKISTFAKC